MTDKLETVRALLAKAERAATPAEAEAYGDKAAALMIKYGIDAAAITPAAERGAPTRRSITLEGYAMAKALVLEAVARSLGCKAVLANTAKKGTKTLLVYGFAADLEAFDVLGTSLLLQATTAATAEHAKTPWIHGKTFRHSFLIGYGQRLNERFTAMRLAAEAAAPAGTDLVLVDRAALIERAVIDDLPAGAKMGKAETRADARSYAAGQVAADRADLNANSRVGASVINPALG